MYLRHIIITILAFISGTAISAGTFAFLLVIGVVPRMIRATHLKNKIILLENIIIAGILVGTMLSFWQGKILLGIAGRLLLICYGAAAGVFVGCIAVALAEFLDTFPILFRRLKLMDGLEWIMFAMAFGKMVGAFCFFWFGYGIM